MKKTIVAGMLLISLFSLAGCGSADNKSIAVNKRLNRGGGDCNYVCRKPNTRMIVLDNNGKEIKNPVEGQIGHCSTECSSITYKYTNGSWKYVNATKTRDFTY